MIDAFVVTLGVILIAELGDKSQLLTLAFATRYPARLVLAGVTIAALVMHGAAVLLGRAFALALPAEAIQLAAGLAFLAFAAWTLRDTDGDAPEVELVPRRRAWRLATVAGAFILAELGDKTMLVTVTLAATLDPWGTWLGASAGMVAVNVLSVAVGAALGARLPERAMRLLAAAAFVVFGVLLIAGGVGIL